MKEHKAIEKNSAKNALEKYGSRDEVLHREAGEKKIQELPEKAEKERYRTQKWQLEDQLGNQANWKSRQRAGKAEKEINR